MNQASKEQGVVGLVRVERVENPTTYHLASVVGGCPDAEQTYCGLPLVELLAKEHRLVPTTNARRTTHRPGRRRRSTCCPGCWRAAPNDLK